MSEYRLRVESGLRRLSLVCLFSALVALHSDNNHRNIWIKRFHSFASWRCVCVFVSECITLYSIWNRGHRPLGKFYAQVHAFPLILRLILIIE
jgi:hypothetical protein